MQQLARLNGVAVEELSSKFTVEPSVQQTLEDQIQQSAAFLTLINVTPVTEQSGHSRYNWQKVGQISTRKCQ
ncbi:P2 family phage major capsid protein [Escherichia coli]|nr:P2 family phage major capsid protein [Escherichia coli]